MSNKSHTNGNKGKSSMELIAMHHMHGWMDDPEKTFGLFIELFQPLGQDALQNIDSPRNPGIFSVNYKVEDVARATRELEMQGIRKVWSDDRGAVKQSMFASDRTNWVNIELSEYSGNDFIKATGMELPA
ncbi:hypothetical protein [Clostridium estertheticum]|uniref:hypothetical protein n=1 Tax=Clostridium estertheticum TaxID=238834 RepID=UPI001CF31706|nr:hypothetical protein [Clostridium estertheticum]MCB2354835.1 hypothetical protein [Clostridium estertheticum]WAG41077.1 hypothetical protein LL065_23050 [Clostridium estertheticum]